MKPYYDEGGITIYHGDCREILPSISADVMVTDPPYGIDHASGWAGPLQGVRIANDKTTEVRDEIVSAWDGSALIFGTWRIPRPPVPIRAVLVWDKGSWGMGDLSLPWTPSWEEVYVVGGAFAGRRDNGVLRHNAPNTLSGRVHPNEKPIELMRALVGKCLPLARIVDPFMGSGTTLRAAKDLGRSAVGIEMDERYCEIAATRLGQEVLDFGEAA